MRHHSWRFCSQVCAFSWRCGVGWAGGCVVFHVCLWVWVDGWVGWE